MLARHPLNGKDIRIISLDTYSWKEQKTLAWFDKAPDTSRWSRWDLGANSVAAARLFPADVVLCLDSHEDVAAWCEEGGWSKARIVAVPRSFVTHMGFDKLMTLRMGNLVCLDELHELYPFVGEKWDGTLADAQILLAMIIQVRQTFPVKATGRPPNGLHIQATLPDPPQPLWLITQYYTPETARRRNEIDTCLSKNTECSLIDKIVLLNEKTCLPKQLQNPKIVEHVIGKRLTYADMIRWIYENVPSDTLVAFANADIFLDDSWRDLWFADLEKVPKFFALLRWEVQTADEAGVKAAKIFGPRADSQDTWVVSSNAIKALTWDWSTLDFPFGKGGCDNSITIEMFKKRFIVSNPSLTLKTYHFHASGIRGYNPKDIVYKPVYLYISPTGLHDKVPVKQFDDLCDKSHKFEFAPFERRLKGPLSQSQARTFCTMVARSSQNKVMLEPDAANLWSPEPISLYKVNRAFQTRDGLVYDNSRILVGSSESSAKAWSESQISYLSASLSVENAMIAPIPDCIANTSGRFILEYMSKVFLLQEVFGEKGEFWCSKNPACIEAIKMFSWPQQEIPVLSRDENQQTWCSKGAMWPYQDTESEFISREEVGALRRAFNLGGWVETPGKNLVIVVDSKWITQDVADSLEGGFKDTDLTVKIIWSDRTSLDASLRSIRGAWGVIMFDQALAPWCWVLPKNGFLWDIQSEMAPSAILLHSASAAELNYRLTIVPRGANDVEKKSLVSKLIRAIHEENLSPIPPSSLEKSSKPKLFLPSGHKGFYDHAGDSFREMARLWDERGFVDCVQSPCHQIWLNAVGDTLLYDRPTYQWLEQAPSAERRWRKALFGNPAPKEGGSAWSFWPRRPALVEDAVAKGLPKRSWEARQQSVVFYGRSENAVQKERRSNDWAPACSEFVHVDGLKKYPYTQEEYLERLSNSRYGLCLAGYGYKCHREIECMAMGCVPIVAQEVDMENYAEPPQEGLHYLRVKTASDVTPMIETITAERWTVMSVACRDWWERNASVNGMWELTNRLI